MNNLESLIKTVLVGTSKTSFQPSDKEELELLGFNPEQMNFTNLLELAAIYNKRKQAGMLLSTFDKQLPAVCPTDLLSPPNEKSIGHLRFILAGRFRKALNEYLYHIQKSAKRLPDESLPILLNIGVGDKKLRAILSPILGEKGKWLLQQNEDWNYFEVTANQDSWDYGNLKERTSYLDVKRQETPLEALEELTAVWSKESAQAKITFLSSLQHGLSKEDEPFLEKCLDDKRKEIRTKSAALLNQIADSELNQRLQEQLKQFITIKKGLLGGVNFEITLPDQLSEGLQRDGIVLNLKENVGGTKSGWLGQIISKTPPKFWRELLDKDPIKILQLVANSEWAETLTAGIFKATILHKDKDWIYALLNFWVDNRHLDLWKGIDFHRITSLLDREEFNRLLSSLIARHKNIMKEDPQISTLLLDHRFEWESKLSLAIIRQFQDWLKTDAIYSAGYHFRHILDNAAYRIPTSCSEQINKNWPEGSSLWKRWERDIDKFQSVLAFRKTMIKEIYQP